jgi:hypothetical protein
MHAKRVNRDVYVIGIIERTAEHFVDHLEQIRELKRELGLDVVTSGPVFTTPQADAD